MDLQELNQAYIEHCSMLSNARTSLSSYKQQEIVARAAVADIDESVTFINEAVKLTQDEIKDQVESLVTTAMEMVFDKHYDFELRFDRVGNRLDCKAVLIDGDRVMDDLEFDVGGSRIDTISIALRVVIWSLEDDQPRGVFILDEPFTSLGGSHLLDRTLEVIQRLSQELGIQMIIITHIERAQAIADRAWNVVNIDGKIVSECTVGQPTKIGRIKA